MVFKSCVGVGVVEKSNTTNGFKETEIGMIPEDWEVAKLIDHVDLERGTEPGSDSYNKEGKGLRFLRVVDISGSREDIIYTLSDNIKLCSVDDILITFDGSPGIVRRGLEGAYSSGIRKVLFKDIKLDKDFIYFALQTNFVKNKIEEFSTGVTIKHASKSIPQIQLPLPPLPEQKKIAAVLSAVQEAKEKTDDVIKAAKELKKSLMKKLFTEGVIIGFMFDTNIFNAILDGNIQIDDLPRNFSYFVTEVQKDELEKTPDQWRKQKLLEVFKSINQKNIPTSTGVLGFSSWGNCCYSDGVFYKKILNDLNQIEKKKNNFKDALIGETAIQNGLILVTNDKALAEVVKKNSGQAINLKDFFAGLYTKLKQTEIGMIPEDWEVVKLGERVILVMGQSPPGSTYNEVCQGMPFLQGKAEFGELSPKYVKYTTKPLKVAPRGSILISVRAPVGDVNIANIDFCIGRGLASLSLKNGENIFLFYLLKYLKSEIEKEGTGSTFKEINKSKLQEFKIPLPPLPVQQKIAEILSAVDKKIEAEENKKKSLEDLFKTLLNNLMTGKIRVNNLEV